MSVDELRERYLPALAELLPARARGAGRALPGDARARRDVPRRARQRGAAPGPRTTAPGLVLAGTWTDDRLAGDARGRGAQRPCGRRAALGRARAGDAAGRRPRRWRRMA